MRERDSFFAVWYIRVLSALQLFSSCTKKECSTLKILVCLGLTNPMLHITFSFYPCSQTIALDTPFQKIRHPHMVQINGLTYKHLKWEEVRFTMIRSDCLIRFSLQTTKRIIKKLFKILKNGNGLVWFRFICKH